MRLVGVFRHQTGCPLNDQKCVEGTMNKIQNQYEAKVNLLITQNFNFVILLLGNGGQEKLKYSILF